MGLDLKVEYTIEKFDGDSTAPEALRERIIVDDEGRVIQHEYFNPPGDPHGGDQRLP